MIQKLALPLSITLLALAILIFGITNLSPNFAKPHPVGEAILYDESDNANDEESRGPSAVILGKDDEIEPTPQNVPAKNYYAPPTEIPTAIPTQVIAPPQQISWGGFSDKESYCHHITNGAMEIIYKDPPYVDQSDLPPELRVSIDFDAMRNGIFRDCMNGKY